MDILLHKISCVRLLCSGYLGSHSLGLKRPGRQADPFPPTSFEDKKMWIYTMFRHKEDFTFYFYRITLYRLDCSF
jgi:hypothetical protein